jgi:hypothetical protein
MSKDEYEWRLCYCFPNQAEELKAIRNSMYWKCSESKLKAALELINQYPSPVWNGQRVFPNLPPRNR